MTSCCPHPGWKSPQTGERRWFIWRSRYVQVLHGFDTVEQAKAYLKTGLFTSDVVAALEPLLDAAPDVRIYQAAA